YLPPGQLLDVQGVSARTYRDEFLQIGRPSVEDPLRARRAGVVEMILDQLAEPLLIETSNVREVDQPMAFEIADLVAAPLHDLVLARHRLEVDHGKVTAALEVALLFEHIGGASRHACGKVATRRPDHHHHAAGHIFAAVVARALYHGDGARVTHGEALAGDSAEIALAGDRAIKHCVADDDRLLRHDGGVFRGTHD